jgi:putative ABC transport system ATP-binding protein
MEIFYLTDSVFQATVNAVFGCNTTWETHMIVLESVSLEMGNTQIFSDLNLVVEKNEKCLIIGKSGIGKTSLFRMLLGFEPAGAGHIAVNGLPLDREHIHEIRSQIFYLSQDIDLADQILSPLIDRILTVNFPDKPYADKLDHYLDFLDLPRKILEKKTSDLSGGERQRVGLLIGFLLDRPVWLLDEPTSALDDAMKEKLSSHILGLDKTVVIISHDHVWQHHDQILIKRWS